MKKVELLNNNFLKQFKTDDALKGFFEGTTTARYREDVRRRAGRLDTSVRFVPPGSLL
jgi:hypothetical protein